MPVKYIVVPYRIPSKPDDPVTYYPRIKYSGEIDIRGLAAEISGISTVSTIDTMAVIEGLLQRIPVHIANGEIIRLGELGSLYLTVKARGSEDKNAITASSHILNNRLRFRASKILRKILADIKYVKEEG